MVLNLASTLRCGFNDAIARGQFLEINIDAKTHHIHGTILP